MHFADIRIKKKNLWIICNMLTEFYIETFEWNRFTKFWYNRENVLKDKSKLMKMALNKNSLELNNVCIKYWQSDVKMNMPCENLKARFTL